jgi:hypothetical protein
LLVPPAGVAGLSTGAANGVAEGLGVEDGAGELGVGVGKPIEGSGDAEGRTSMGNVGRGSRDRIGAGVGVGSGVGVGPGTTRISTGVPISSVPLQSC